MENHPIPQDVTGFKFKLIGSVTVKQFLYILGGGILAAVFFILPIPALIKLPFSFFCGIIGVALAFVPIEGRPMDVMIKNFLKALPAENQFIYRKKGAEALILEFFTPTPLAVAKVEAPKSPSEESLDKRRALLYKTLKQSYKPDEKEQAVLTNINAYLHDATPQPTSIPVQNADALPSSSPALQIVTPSVTIATKEVNETPTSLQVATQQAPVQNPPQTPDPQVVISVAQKIQSLSNQASGKLVMPTAPVTRPVRPMETPMAKPTPAIQTPEALDHVTQEPVVNPLPTDASPLQTTQAAPLANTVEPDKSANVTTVTPEKSLLAGFPQLPDTPNVVLGIIKDPRNKVLPNILVEIMDVQGIPVRAFKTNALGQFAAATPLPNGEYNVLLEDPRKQNEFEQIHIKLDGEIFNPLEIVSVDQREKLRRELFGGAQQAA